MTIGNWDHPLFDIKIEEGSWDYKRKVSYSIIATLNDFIIRNGFIKEGCPNKADFIIANDILLRWFYTHVFFYSQISSLTIKFLLLFRKKEAVKGAVIKVLFNKTYIYETKEQ